MRERIRSWLQPLRGTPLHPQWFSFRDEIGWLRHWAGHARGVVVDVGCGRQRIRPFLDPSCRYVGTDFYATARNLYQSRPELYADARALPLADASADTVLLVEVLEHVAQPERALSEALRVLRPGGTLVVSVPFLYPVHDAPFDFQRWTPAGIREVLGRTGFQLVEYRSVGSPAETAALIGSIAVARLSLNLLRRYGPLGALALPVAAVLVIAINLLGWSFRWAGRDDELMPHACRAVGRKPAARATGSPS